MIHIGIIHLSDRGYSLDLNRSNRARNDSSIEPSGTFLGVFSGAGIQIAPAEFSTCQLRAPRPHIASVFCCRDGSLDQRTIVQLRRSITMRLGKPLTAPPLRFETVFLVMTITFAVITIGLVMTSFLFA